MDANLVAFYSAYGRAEGSVLRQAGDAVWFYTGIPHPLFNGVLRAQFDARGVQAAIDDLQDAVAAQGAPASWWLGPEARPDDLGSLLRQHALELIGEVPGMALELRFLDSQVPGIPNFTVERVGDEAQRTLWARVAATGNGFSDRALSTMARIEATLSDSAYRAQHRYIGYLDGKPVASAALVLDAGVAGIYAVATLPEARQRGIGRVMTMQPLLAARRLGYHVAVLQASSMGYGVYEKLGFVEAGKYRLYLQAGR